ncbi:MAG: acetylserotonin O-methyltransferase [Alphaproteobacteria bacterium]|nr:acetylserotonin O-methyltransferase [Alphaproteobacteria bacterium]
MPDRPPDTARLQSLAQAYGRSAALMSAVELGLFTAVSKGAGTVAEIADALEIHPVNAERLVTMCAALDLVERQDGRFVNAPDVERFLVEGTGRYAGDWMLFTKPAWNEWGRLTDHLRAKDLHVLPDIAGYTVEQARAYHEATYSIGMGAGRRFVRQVDLSGRTKILDLGGGSGAYCIAAAKEWPDIAAVVFDLSPVVEVARDFIAEHGLSDRVDTLAGDFTSDPFPDDADVVIMASNLPMYGPEMIQAVVTKAFDALLPGGEMHLIGETLNDDRSGPVSAAFWGLGQALPETMGVAHSEADCTGYFETAGFVEVAVHPFVEGVLSRVTGRKPA